MSASLLRHLEDAKIAIIVGNPYKALGKIEEFSNEIVRKPPDKAVREALDAHVTHIRNLAETSLRGAQMAADQVRAIIDLARSLQTYDNAGQRRATSTVSHRPRRY